MKLPSFPIRALRLFFGCLLGTAPLAVAAAAVVPAQATSAEFRVFIAPQTLRSDQVTLLWEKPGAGAPRVSYEVLCDGQPVGTTQAVHFTVRKLDPSHSYVFAVRLKSSPGSSAAHSNEVHVRTPAQEKVLSVEDFGAKGDGATKNTKAIQAAIDACPPHGVVLIPRGVFVSGALFLKSDMTLEIAAGGTLKGSTALSDYEPFILNRFEGWELETYASLLNAGKLDHGGPANIHNLSIRGEGTLSGGGAPLATAMIEAHGLRSRGRLLCLMNCENLEIQGLTLEQPPSWTLHYIYSENVSCHDLTINTAIRNGDGIDPDSSKNSYIFNCAFDTGDDCIAIKSGKNPEGNVVNRPTENVWVVDCRFKAGHGISIGSEMSGGVRNVLVQDCIAGNLLNGLQIKATRERGNVVENVTVRDCDLQKISILTALPYNNDGEAAPEPPYFRNFHFANLDFSAAKPDSAIIIVNGFAAAGHRTRNVTFEHVTLPRGAIVKLDETEAVTFKDVKTVGGGKPTYEVTHSDQVSY